MPASHLPTQSPHQSLFSPPRASNGAQPLQPFGHFSLQPFLLMRTKVTLVLLFLNVVLFYYISHFEGPSKIGPRGHSVYGSEVASINSFSRKDRSGTALLLEKKIGDNWWLSKPYEWPANRNAINSIISELQHLNNETSFAVDDLLKNGRTLAEYGLADPALSFTFISGGKSYETKVGDATKVGNRLYLLSPDGSRIHVVGSSLIDSIGMSIDRLRSESIFSIPPFEVRSLSLQTASKVRLRREGSRWIFETPIQARANINAVDTTITALNGLLAQKFIETREAADPAITGLSAPEIRVTLEGNARRETLLIGLPAIDNTSAPRSENGTTYIRPTYYFAKIEDKTAVFITALPAKLLTNLRNAQEFLRDTHILEFDPRTVTGITLSAPGQPELFLQRLDPVSGAETWQLINRRNTSGQAPKPIAADTTLVTELLQKLEMFSSTKFLSDAPSDADRENYGFNRPEREITLMLSTGGGPQGKDPSTLTLQIGQKPEEPGVAYARLSSATSLFQVDPSILEYTSVDPRQFRRRLLRDLPEGARITGLTLAETGTSTTNYRRQLKDGETWENALTAEPEARQKALIALLAQLRVLRAQRFVAETFNPEHADLAGAVQPWKFRLEATLALNGGNGATQTSTSVLLLTDRIGGTTQLAGSSEENVTFALTQEMIDALFALTYAEQHDPGPPKPEPASGT